jgi:peptidoglycan DL-endopeptidase CwlO
LADHGQRGRLRASIALGAVSVGAITGTMAIVPASADPDPYPSWQDVQQARGSTVAAQAEVTRITDLLVKLQDAADAAGRSAQIAEEKAHQAKDAEDAARAHGARLAAQAAAARKKAATSRMRAGLLAAHLSRAGGGDVTLNLALNGARADDLLYQLATMSQLSQQAAVIYKEAVEDANTAAALEDQVGAATATLADRARAASTALDEAQTAASAARDAVAEQQRHQDQLVAQLAQLQNTSTRLAAQYVAGVAHQRAEAAAAKQAAADRAAAEKAAADKAAADKAAAEKAARDEQQHASGGSSSGGSSSSSGGSSGGSTSGGSSSSSGSTSSGSSSSGGSPSAGGSVPQPNSAAAASAVAYARDQIGEPYRFAGAGPSVWDCSGLTMMAYQSVGIAIGGHGATAQYNHARSLGLLVPYSQAQVGDLIFYTDGGGDMYHVAIYSGSGMMIEAPYDGVPVREVPVRSNQRVGYVARPTG